MKIFTIGVFGFTEKTFYDALSKAGVTALCDIRRRRGVRGAHNAFANSTQLQSGLATRGIRYVHLLELAPSDEVRTLQMKADTRHRRPNTRRTELDPAFVKAYTATTLRPLDFRKLVDDHHLEDEVIALLCVEAIPEACHRSLAARWMAQHSGTGIVHLLPGGNRKEDS